MTSPPSFPRADAAPARAWRTTVRGYPRLGPAREYRWRLARDGSGRTACDCRRGGLDGCAVLADGGVPRDGSRCVRAPMIHGDVTRPGPLTVPETAYAPSRTMRPVQGRRTGPVPMLSWRFVRDALPREPVVDQCALAVRGARAV